LSFDFQLLETYKGYKERLMEVWTQERGENEIESVLVQLYEEELARKQMHEQAFTNTNKVQIKNQNFDQDYSN